MATGFYRTCVIDGLLEHSPAEHPARATSRKNLDRHPNYILAAYVASGP